MVQVDVIFGRYPFLIGLLAQKIWQKRCNMIGSFWEEFEIIIMVKMDVILHYIYFGPGVIIFSVNSWPLNH